MLGIPEQGERRIQGTLLTGKCWAGKLGMVHHLLQA